MHNDALTHDYVIRAGKRLLAVEVLVRESSWAVVVRECQEIVELSLKALANLIHASKSLRRDRELAFYGSEDLTPSEFYNLSDAEAAIAFARQTHTIVAASIKTTQ